MTDDARPDAPQTQTPAPKGSILSSLSGKTVAGAALAVSVLALGASVAPYLTGGDFGGRVRAYLIENPQVLDEVLAARRAPAGRGWPWRRR